MKTTTTDDIDATTCYAVGRVIELTSADDGGSITIEILKQQDVAHGRNSQVVFVKVVSGVLRRGQDDSLTISTGSTVFAKFYDIKYGPVASGWAHENVQFCQESKDAEKHAYEKLDGLQGSDIPGCYGEYYFSRVGPFDKVSALLLQFIPDPPLYMTWVSTPSKLATLKSRAFEVFQRIHANGVFHGDITPQNLLWNSETERLTVIDFEQAAFNDGDYLIHQENAAEQMALFVKNREEDDIALLWDTLCDIGVTDERPAPGPSPLAPTGW
jgi:hypothetical protein